MRRITSLITSTLCNTGRLSRYLTVELKYLKQAIVIMMKDSWNNLNCFTLEVMCYKSIGPWYLSLVLLARSDSVAKP
jgi:hypothetical protein